MGAQGTAVLDFGAWPGAASATVAVTGQTAITTANLAEAEIRAQNATADHSVDEHVYENLRITARDIVNGVGFTIHGECLNGRSYGQWNVYWVWN